jgi:hypothetical protein
MKREDEEVTKKGNSQNGKKFKIEKVDLLHFY